MREYSQGNTTTLTVKPEECPVHTTVAFLSFRISTSSLHVVILAEIRGEPKRRLREGKGQRLLARLRQTLPRPSRRAARRLAEHSKAST